MNVGQFTQGDLALPGRNKQPLERSEIAAEIPHITHVDGIPFPPQESCSDVLTADGILNRELRVFDAQSVVRQPIAVPLKIQKVPGTSALSKYPPRALYA